MNVKLDILIDTIELSLSDLEEVGEGKLLECDLVRDQSVVLKVGNEKIGKGKLVKVGDAVCIHVTSLNKKGAVRLESSES